MNISRDLDITKWKMLNINRPSMLNINRPSSLSDWDAEGVTAREDRSKESSGKTT